MAPLFDGKVFGVMFKRLLTSTSVRLIVVLLFFGVCTGLTWSDTTHSDQYSHIEKLNGGAFDLEERGSKDLCPAITAAETSLNYLPVVTSLRIHDQYLLSPVLSFVPTVSRAPPV
jgi:hypothetical protein